MGVANPDEEIVPEEEVDVEGEGGESQQEPDDPPEQEEDEVVVQIGDEEPPASEGKQAAPEWVKRLRVEHRELKQRYKELEVRAGKPPQDAPKVPEKPKLADYDYDEDKFQEAMEGWYAKKSAVADYEAQQKARAEKAQEAVKAIHENYAKSKATLKVKDFQDAEDEATAQLSEVQQSLLMAGAQNPAAFVYALGKSPKHLQKLSSITDPVKFAWAASKLEDQVKVTTRSSTKPAPESTVRSSTGSAPQTSAVLDRLMREAEKSGDRTKVAAFHREQKKRKAK